MKKIRLPFIAIVLAALLLSTTACKDPDLELVWTVLEGSGTYNSIDDTSTLKVSGIVEFEIPTVATELITARIYAWELLIWSGDVLVLYINSDNNYDILGDHKLDVSGDQSSIIWLDIETLNPKPGDLYNGANPDSIEMSLWIVDNNENTYIQQGVGTFSFTRD